jgi:hypothetical protein
VPNAIETPEMEIVRLTVRVRRAQVEYFGSKNYATLCRAKDLERVLDRKLKALLGDAGEVNQPGSRERSGEKLL